MTRVSTAAQQSFTLFTALNTQTRLFEAQVQVATGQKSQDFAGIERDAGRLVSIQSELNRVRQFQDNIQRDDGHYLEKIHNPPKNLLRTLIYLPREPHEKHFSIVFSLDVHVSLLKLKKDLISMKES